MKNTQLAKSERALYGDLKKLCHERLHAEMEFSAALMVIREQKLYRAEYGTFEEFCRSEFEMPARSIRRKLAQNKLFKALGEPAGISLSAIGALLPLAESVRVEVLTSATAPGARPTVKQVERIIADGQSTTPTGTPGQAANSRMANADRITATYVERSDAMRLESRGQDLKVIGEFYGDFQKQVAAATSLLLAASNNARAMGIHLQMVCGHEQMGAAFWNTHCAKALPFDLEAGKKFIAVTHKLPDAAASFPEVAQFVTPILLAEKVLQLPERSQAQTASTGTPAQVFYGKLSLLRQAFRKMTLDAGMEEWDGAACDLFMEESEWMEEEREQVRHRQSQIANSQ